MVDSNGVGVAGVDIDFVTLGGGGNPHEFNDGTDANGNFLTTVDAGVYEVRFYPPVPPATTLLTGSVPNVVVVGTKNLGTITLGNGFSLQGTAKNAANQPVGSVKVDIYNAGGALLPLKNNTTSAFGTFNVAVPAGALRLEVRTNLVFGQILVPQRLFTTVSTATNLGTIALQTGFHVTGTARTQAGTAVSGANLDVVDTLTGDTLFTPGDSTTTAGLFDVVLAAGTYDFEVTRPAALALVGAAQNGVTIGATTNLGTFALRSGVFLSGTVRDRKGALVAAADVNVHEVATGLPIALGSDNTNAAGFYSVVVPRGLMNVVFTPPGTRNTLAKDRHNGVEIVANTTLNGRLPGTPASFASTTQSPAAVAPVALPLGNGSLGTGGSTPHVLASANGNTLTLHLFGGRPHAPAQMVLGLSERTLPSAPEVHVVQPLARVALSLDADGSAEFTLPPDEMGSFGRTTFAQFAVLDPAANLGRALSNVIALSTPR
ncbi:MAG: hypothetical protein EXS08_04310 [Planctomycetes bacterium]|nr:hypothetical protein [Planctomycetota bacterium]